MRHGKAEDPSADTNYADRPRRLTSEGISNVKAMIPALKRIDMIPDRILSSPYPRASETAQIIHKGLNVRQALEFTDALCADQSIIPFFQEELPQLLDASERLMVVGHEPCLSQLASLLVSGRLDVRFQLKKAGIIQLSCLARGNVCHGILKSHWTSKQLRSLVL